MHGTDEDHRIYYISVSHWRKGNAFLKGPIIKKVLKQLGLWDDEERGSQLRTARDPPSKIDAPEIVWIPLEDAWHEKSLPTDFSTRVSYETLGWDYPYQTDIVR